MTNKLTGTIHNLPNEEYRAAHGRSATVLKGCLRSAKHGLTPKKRTKSLSGGLQLHEFILERDLFLSKYIAGVNPEDYPEALQSAEELKDAAKKLNESRLPKLKTTGSKESLISEIASDDPMHFDGVDVGALSTTDLKNKIKHINAQPNRGLIPLSGSSVELYGRMVSAGWKGQYIPAIEKQHAKDNEDKTIIPYDEYKSYDDMYQSLINHLTVGAERERKTGEGRLMQWLLYAFTTDGVLETEVSMFGSNDKCRVDARFKAGDKWIPFDLKRSADSSGEGFMRACTRYHYDLQAAHYLNVHNEVGGDADIFPFIAIEPEAPYAVNIFVPSDEFMQLGYQKLEYAKKQLTKYTESSDNTAYEPVIKQLDVPEYAKYGPWSE
jgi:hypothetical protein